MATFPVSEFVGNSDLYDAVTWTKGATARTINVIWFADYQTTDIGNIVVSNAKVYAWAADSDITGIDRTVTLTKGGVVYKVIEVAPDGTGMTMITLSKD